jgi:hypothetical protein
MMADTALRTMKQKRDRRDALKAAQLSVVNQLPGACA